MRGWNQRDLADLQPNHGPSSTRPVAGPRTSATRRAQIRSRRNSQGTVDVRILLPGGMVRQAILSHAASGEPRIEGSSRASDKERGFVPHGRGPHRLRPGILILEHHAILERRTWSPRLRPVGQVLSQ
jgi:hypothetical protein